ncbi:MAG: SDR family NAD(P)-dependent oxidoreductase, partial [Thermoleophilia bacterium]|nr:SDR family NAD(P)-dependent oxidoreductase [Thermoleophilia bacterium]
MHGRVVLVTGGGRGVGRGIATRFLEAGADVVICGRKSPESPLQVGDRSATFVQADVRVIEDVDRLIGEVVAAHGRLDVLVNNAGGSPSADSATVSPRFSASIIHL